MSKGIPHEELDYSRTNGDSYRIRECNNCIGLGNSLAVQVTRKADGFLWHCYRCTLSGFHSDTGASPSQVRRQIKAMGTEKKDTRPEVVTLPRDFTSAIPPQGLVQLYDTGVTDKDIDWFNIGWSEAHKRIVIPIYKYIGKAQQDTGKVWARKLVGYVGRKLATDTSDKPKWFSVRQRDLTHPRFMGLPRQNFPDKTVVLVEDVFSSIRVAQTGQLSIALLTTYLPYELYPLLRGWKVYLWLDADAFSKAVKYQAALGSNGVTAVTIFTPNDPKTYTQDEITEAIKHGRLKGGGSEN